MKLILIIILSCTFTAVCFAAGRTSELENELNLKVALIKRRMRSDKLDAFFFELAEAYKTFGRWGIIRFDKKLDDLTSRITDEEVKQKVTEELQSLDEYIRKILENWKGKEEWSAHGPIDVQLKRELEWIDNANEDEIPYLASLILGQSQLCTLFVDSNQLQGEAAKFARIAFVLAQMSLRNVHPDPLNNQGKMMAKLGVYCNELKLQDRNVRAIFDQSSSDIRTTGI